jgi:hypothetical protein
MRMTDSQLGQEIAGLIDHDVASVGLDTPPPRAPDRARPGLRAAPSRARRRYGRLPRPPRSHERSSPTPRSPSGPPTMPRTSLGEIEASAAARGGQLR